MMLVGAVIGRRSEHVNKLCGQNAESIAVIMGGLEVCDPRCVVEITMCGMCVYV